MRFFNDSVLRDVGRCTTTVVERGQNIKTLLIAGTSHDSREHATRLLLSLLALPSPCSTAIADPVPVSNNALSTLGAYHELYLPESSGSNLPLRHCDSMLYRLTVPSKNTNATYDPHKVFDAGSESHVQPALSNQTQAQARHLLRRLNAIGPPRLFDRTTTSEGDSYWDPLLHRPREVHICKVLFPTSGDVDLISNQKARVRSKRGKALNALSIPIPSPLFHHPASSTWRWCPHVFLHPKTAEAGLRYRG